MFGYRSKNENYSYKNIESSTEWLQDLYKNVLLMDVPETDDGLKHWLNRLEQGESREAIYNYFIQVAKKDNAENSKQDFGDILGPEGKENRIGIAIPESLGDCILITSLLKDARELYPDKKIYVFTKPQFKEVFEGNKNIDYVMNWDSFMDNTMLLESQYFEQFIQMHFLNQRMINYLRGGKDKTKIDFEYKEAECI